MMRREHKCGHKSERSSTIWGIFLMLFCFGIPLVPVSAQQQQPTPIPNGWMNGYPQYYNGLVYANWSLTYEAWGSGTVVLPRAVITAGHVIYNTQQSNWAPLVGFIRWNHGSSSWPWNDYPEKWSQMVAASHRFKLYNYTNGVGGYTSYNQDLGGAVFLAPLLPNSSYMQLKAANAGNTTPVANSTALVRSRLQGAYGKSVMCYPVGRYSITHVNRFKMHETLPQGDFIFYLPTGQGLYDSVGMPSMWYRSPQLRANGGGCSGGSLQSIMPAGRVLLGVVISDSAQYGLGVRGLNSSAIALIYAMSLH